jgi:hypothetical protein
MNFDTVNFNSLALDEYINFEPTAEINDKAWILQTEDDGIYYYTSCKRCKFLFNRLSTKKKMCENGLIITNINKTINNTTKINANRSNYYRSNINSINQNKTKVSEYDKGIKTILKNLSDVQILGKHKCKSDKYFYGCKTTYEKMFGNCVIITVFVTQSKTCDSNDKTTGSKSTHHENNDIIMNFIATPGVYYYNKYFYPEIVPGIATNGIKINPIKMDIGNPTYDKIKNMIGNSYTIKKIFENQNVAQYYLFCQHLDKISRYNATHSNNVVSLFYCDKYNNAKSILKKGFNYNTSSTKKIGTGTYLSANLDYIMSTIITGNNIPKGLIIGLVDLGDTFNCEGELFVSEQYLGSKSLGYNMDTNKKYNSLSTVIKYKNASGSESSALLYNVRKCYVYPLYLVKIFDNNNKFFDRFKKNTKEIIVKPPLVPMPIPMPIPMPMPMPTQIVFPQQQQNQQICTDMPVYPNAHYSHYQPFYYQTYHNTHYQPFYQSQHDPYYQSPYNLHHQVYTPTTIIPPELKIDDNTEYNKKEHDHHSPQHVTLDTHLDTHSNINQKMKKQGIENQYHINITDTDETIFSIGDTNASVDTNKIRSIAKNKILLKIISDLDEINMIENYVWSLAKSNIRTYYLTLNHIVHSVNNQLDITNRSDYPKKSYDWTSDKYMKPHYRWYMVYNKHEAKGKNILIQLDDYNNDILEKKYWEIVSENSNFEIVDADANIDSENETDTNTDANDNFNSEQKKRIKGFTINFMDKYYYIEIDATDNKFTSKHNISYCRQLLVNGKNIDQSCTLTFLHPTNIKFDRNYLLQPSDKIYVNILSHIESNTSYNVLNITYKCNIEKLNNFCDMKNYMMWNLCLTEPNFVIKFLYRDPKKIRDAQHGTKYYEHPKYAISNNSVDIYLVSIGKSYELSSESDYPDSMPRYIIDTNTSSGKKNCKYCTYSSMHKILDDKSIEYYTSTPNNSVFFFHVKLCESNR